MRYKDVAKLTSKGSTDFSERERENITLDRTGIVLGLEHRTPGKGNALIAATIRSTQTGKTKTIRFASSDKVEIVETDRQQLEFSYVDSSGYNFMDLTTYETVAVK